MNQHAIDAIKRRANMAESVCLKLIYKFTRRLDYEPPNQFGYKARATYPYLKEQCHKTADCTIGIFDKCFKKALQQQLIWETKDGLYTTRRPQPRTIDDEWDC